jgi:dTDP-D-glucose 4,6-dehydratase
MSEQAGDVRRTFADVSKAESLFGYRPSVPFPEGVRRFADWYRARHESPRWQPAHRAESHVHAAVAGGR